MVSQRGNGTGFGLARSGFSALIGMAKPRLAVTRLFNVMMPCTRPSRSSTGPPLLPGSTGMASCNISPSSMSRRAESTPCTTLPVNPIGLPIATTGAPCTNLPESPSGNAFNDSPPFTRSTAKSSLRSHACTATTSSFFPSPNCTCTGRASPTTWRQVAIRFLPTTNPVPVPSFDSPRPAWTTVTTDGLAALISSATGFGAAYE